MATDPHLFRVDAVRKQFEIGRGFRARKQIVAVDDVSLEVRRGETLGIVGESGSGKTTLVKMMLGLMKPSHGLILLENKPISDWTRRDLARHVQFIFQDPYSALNPRHSIGQIIGQPLLIHGVGDKNARDASIRHMLDVVGLPQRISESYPSQISGGQRQRVVIARALVLRPKVVICDEPTSALDVSVQSQILNLLSDMRREFGLTYIIVSHDLAVIEHMADRVAVMYQGRVVELSDASELFERPKHPYTRLLLSSSMTASLRPEKALASSDNGASSPNDGCRFLPRCRDALSICSTIDPRPRRCGEGVVECHLVPNDDK
jgi:peptide/nickel transport system ATP-binding protein